MKWTIIISSISFAALACMITPKASAVQFIPLPGSLYALGVSGDGTTVVGTGSSGFRWTSKGGIQYLPGLSTADAVSYNGSIVAGSTGAGSAAIWTEINGAQPIGPTPPQIAFSTSRGISADGSVVVGAIYPVNGPPSAFRWDPTTGFETISKDLLGGIDSAIAVSDDGNFIVGIEGQSAFKWTRATGPVKLYGVAGKSDAWGVSADGSVVVGEASGQAFRWTAFPTGLGDLPGGAFSSAALDVTPDGNTVVGYGTTDRGLEAFIWTKAKGMQSLMDVLSQYDVNIGGWQLQSARGISDDGRVIAGIGLNPQGKTEGWVIIIPEPAPCTLAVVGFVAFVIRRRPTSHKRV